MDNLEKLVAAGIAPEDHQLTPAELAIIAALSREEVEALVQGGGQIAARDDEERVRFQVVF